MTQITLRNVPDGVKHKIQLVAHQRGQSMNAAAISLLQESLGLKPQNIQHRDLSGIFGTWTDEAMTEFEDNTSIFGEIDEDLWSDL